MADDTSSTLSVTAAGTTTQLRGPWLWAARVLWGIAVVITLIALVVATPLRLDYLRQVSPQANSTQGQLLPEDAQALEQLGLSPGIYSAYFTVLELIVAGAALLVAGLLFWRRSDDRAVVAISFAFVASVFASSPLISTTTGGLPVWGAISTIMLSIAVGGSMWGLLVFPDGRFVPRWTRWVAVVWIAYAIAAIFFPAIQIQPALFWETSVEQIVVLWFFIMFSVCLGSQVYRYARVSTPSQRQQTKWVLLGLAAMFGTIAASGVVVLAFPALLELGVPKMIYKMMAISVTLLSEIGLVVAFAFSLLRYRVWDVDFVINRSLAYGTLTLLLGGLFIGIFFILRTLLASVLGSGQDLIAVAIPAVAITALFSPAQKTLRRLIDQRLYGIKLDYVEAIKAYGDIHRGQQKAGRARTSFGSYTGLELLGRGGMGEVYRAQHPTLNRSVAIKILPAHLEASAESHQRFLREAQTIAALKHPNIVTLHDIGEQDGTPFMVMEYVEGATLADLLRQRGRLPLGEALPMLRDVAAALDYAHGQGVIHRDIKPSNVIIETPPLSPLPLQGEGTGVGSGRAVLMDFGIARIAAASQQLTRSGGFIGTLDYVAPEQIQGASAVDARADVYSLGVMTYQVLTGELPFKHNNPGATVMAHLMQPPPDPRQKVADLPEGAAIAVMRAMSKQPDERYPGAGEFVAALAG